jgi:hypothetical protein
VFSAEREPSLARSGNLRGRGVQIGSDIIIHPSVLRARDGSRSAKQIRSWVLMRKTSLFTEHSDAFLYFTTRAQSYGTCSTKNRRGRLGSIGVLKLKFPLPSKVFVAIEVQFVSGRAMFVEAST